MKIQDENKRSQRSIRDFMDQHLFQYDSYHRKGEEKCLEDKIEALLTFQADLIERLLLEKVISFSDFMEVLGVDYSCGYSLTKD